MENVFASEYGGSYLMVVNGSVEDVGCSFASLTGYSIQDFSHKRISEVMHQLFCFNIDVENRREADHFLFKKSGESIEVRVKTYRVGRDNRRLYLFKPRHNFILNSELSLVNRLIKDNHSGVGLYSCPEFRLLKANQKYIDYLRAGCHCDVKPIGLCLHELIPNYSGSSAERIWRNVYETGETAFLKEQQTIFESGDHRYWNETITLLSEGGKEKYIISLLDDITDTVLKRRNMEEKNKELEHAIQMKDEMLMLISHELKTPLSIITSSIQTVELVCNNELSEKVKKYLNKIKQNAYQQMKLVNNILDNTRVNSGHFKINRSTVDIVLLTRTIIDSISVFAERKGVMITLCSKLSQSVIVTDIDIYERIMLNLLSNAVKFTPEGKSIEVIVFPVSVKTGKQVCIQVKDSGIGIPNDQKELIFERFGRVNRVKARQSEGTGIGLYLVKMLVSLLNGEIKVESKENVGSTFSMLLPFEQSNKASGEAVRLDKINEQLVKASAIEFSDIYFGA